MIWLILIAGYFLLMAASVLSFIAGVCAGYPLRRRQQQTIADLTAQLAAATPKRPPITVSYGIGVPLGILLQHRPEINQLRDKVVAHWREHSKPDDELIH